MKGTNVVLLMSTFPLTSILFPPTLKRISVYHKQSTEGKLNSEIFVSWMLGLKITHFFFLRTATTRKCTTFSLLLGSARTIKTKISKQLSQIVSKVVQS